MSMRISILLLLLPLAGSLGCATLGRGYDCVDTDGGKKYFVHGEVRETAPDGTINDQIDKCRRPEKKVLVEYYCSLNRVRAKTYPCPAGCDKGYCLE